MSNELPPLPAGHMAAGFSMGPAFYTADQVRGYGRLCRSDAEARIAELEAALRELVACKDLKDRFTARTDFRAPGAYELHQVEVDDHYRREPLAWTAARAALKREAP